jgi:aspartate aminotransferase
VSGLAGRLTGVSASGTMAAAAEAERLRRAGHDVVDLSAGEPDFPTPEHVKAAARAAIDADFTRYTAVGGVPELREAICARYAEDYGVRVTPAEVLVTAGGKQGLFNTALALLDPGDEVITHTPCWPTIPEQIRLMGARPVLIATRPGDGFAVEAAAILGAITPRTKAIVINSPCNPTGAVVDEQTVAAVAEAAARHGVWVIADLCYERLIYDAAEGHNLPRVLFDWNRDRTVLVGSASKAYAMTGWRCGWTIAPPALTAAMHLIQGQSTSNVSSITQKAALAALIGPQDAVSAMREQYRQRRDAIHAWVTAHPGIRCVKPRGAFYLFPDVSRLIPGSGLRSSADVARDLLEQEHVAVTAGEVFDAPGHLRLSYATSMDRLREGADRLLRRAAAWQPAGDRDRTETGVRERT